ncbi:phage tail tube protein [Methylopila sp. 73B]|uniref:phage tail tube protein n=1 Tax=Methylopila sp. 73B TaxID=1120792 RepID=UPI00035FFA99|nr:phage tail tube protein [Methylopila sp. 73B]
MALPDHSGTRVAYVAEATYGVTPATPSFKTFRTTRASGLSTRKTTAVSDEIRADRNVVDEAQLGQDASGDYPVELSYGSFDDFLEALLMGAWTTNVLKNGIARKSFTVEETRELGATDSFSRFTGVMVNRGEFSVNAREKALCTFGLMGQKEALVSAIVTGATYAAASTEPMMTAASVASLSIAGVAGPPIKSLSFSVTNTLRVRPLVGSLYSDEFGAGECNVTGSFSAYFAAGLYQMVLDHGGGELVFTIGATANKKYTFRMPNTVFLDGTVPAGGKTDDVMLNVPFRAKLDVASACSIQITRAVA